MNPRKKLSTKDIEELEAESWLDWLSTDQLDDPWLACCSENVRNALAPLSPRDRAYALDGTFKKWYYPGGPCGPEGDYIWVDVLEIEWQFDGKPEDNFEDPNDYTIMGNLAYYYVGYGLVIEIDLLELLANIAILLSG